VTLARKIARRELQTKDARKSLFSEALRASHSDLAFFASSNREPHPVSSVRLYLAGERKDREVHGYDA
jgi:hypothetical protein